MPSQRRTVDQGRIISNFHFRPEKLDRSEFTRIYSAASALLEEVDGGPGFRYDTLRIEVSGPKQPDLTLVVSSCVVPYDAIRRLTDSIVGFAWTDQICC
jgi:hypothetical protein